MKRLALLLALSVLAISVGLYAQPQQKGDAQNGKKVFGSVGCYECHGYVGQGGSAGPRIAPNPLPFDAFSKYVRTPTDQMPPFTAKALPDKDLVDIYAYLQSIPKPPAVKDLPQLNK